LEIGIVPGFSRGKDLVSFRGLWKKIDQMQSQQSNLRMDFYLFFKTNGKMDFFPMSKDKEEKILYQQRPFLQKRFGPICLAHITKLERYDNYDSFYRESTHKLFVSCQLSTLKKENGGAKNREGPILVALGGDFPMALA